MFKHSLARAVSLISDNPYINGVCNVFIMLLPVSLISAFCMLLGNATSYFELHEFSQRLYSISTLVWQLFPILLIVYYSQFLASMHKLERISLITPSIVIYFIVSYQWELLKVGTVIPTNYPLAIMLPMAICFCLKLTKQKRKRQKIELPNVVEKSIEMILSCSVLVFSFSTISYILRHIIFEDVVLASYFPHLDPHSLLDGIVYELARNLFWAIGVNGHIVLASYKSEIYHMSMHLVEQHQTLGTPLPILTSNFYDFYAGLGGAGNTLSLVMCMILFSRNDSYKKLGCAVLILSLFNINEPVIYGLPIMFNPILIIPFLTIPVLSLMIAYFATSLGFVPPISEVMSWMTPPLISGYVGTGNSINGAILQALIIGIGVLIYFPFFRKYENLGRTRHIFTNSASKEFFNNDDVSKGQSMNTFIPHLSNNISAQKCLNELQESGEFTLFYQPQYDITHHQVVGLEVLIRHKGYDGKITPPYFLSSFASLGIMQDLDLWVIETALHEVTPFADSENFKVSINVSSDTLLIDNFASSMRKLVDSSALQTHQVELEITEDVLVKDENKTKQTVDELRASGISVALDDFGAGFSSLGYLSKFEFDKVKIDRSFVLNLSSDKGKELFKLTSQLVQVGGATVVVEGVEEKEELEFISKQNISLIQGFYFYKPMPFENIIELNLYSTSSSLAAS
ncbi:EAL domain-containing protein [Vibrio gallaecicus]|uniref:EAL domain-containing protein n=1 Tax=Vibrio gallaecicus TaxID=552386 RepID=A0ABV4N9J1_9VIBR